MSTNSTNGSEEVVSCRKFSWSYPRRGNGQSIISRLSDRNVSRISLCVAVTTTYDHSKSADIAHPETSETEGIPHVCRLCCRCRIGIFQRYAVQPGAFAHLGRRKSPSGMSMNSNLSSL